MPIIALLIMFCGFMVARSKMGWMEFIYWANPAGWAIQSLAQNEFFAPRYDVALGDTTLGVNYLRFMDQQTSPAYQWAGVGYIAGNILVTGAATFAAFHCVRYDRNMGSARVLEDGPPGGAVGVAVPTGLILTALP